jgi:hypothetical protein
MKVFWKCVLVLGVLSFLGCGTFLGPSVRVTPAGTGQHQITVTSDTEVGVDFDGAFHKKAREICSDYKVVTTSRSSAMYSFKLTGVIECR